MSVLRASGGAVSPSDTILSGTCDGDRRLIGHAGPAELRAGTLSLGLEREIDAVYDRFLLKLAILFGFCAREE